MTVVFENEWELEHRREKFKYFYVRMAGREIDMDLTNDMFQIQRSTDSTFSSEQRTTNIPISTFRAVVEYVLTRKRIPREQMFLKSPEQTLELEYIDDIRFVSYTADKFGCPLDRETLKFIGKMVKRDMPEPHHCLWDGLEDEEMAQYLIDGE